MTEAPLDPEAFIIIGALSIWILLGFAAFGIIVVRRRDPSPHLVLAGSAAVAAVSVVALPYAAGRSVADLRSSYVGAVTASTVVLSLTVALVWAMAVAVRPGEPAISGSWRPWFHAAVVALGSIAAGIAARDGAVMVWWIPNLAHVLLSFRDGPRLRRAWGDIASLGFAITVGLVVRAALDGADAPAFYALSVGLLGHHLVAMAQARHATVSMLLWPLLAVAGSFLLP